MARSRKLGLISGLMVVLLALPAFARADSIVFSRDGDIYLTPPDGSREHRLTNSGFYGFPSQADDGTILALGNDGRFYRMDRQGRQLGTPFYPGVPGGADITSPLDPVLSPDGTKIAYWYIIRGGYFDRDCNCERTRGETSWAVSDSDALTPESKYASNGAYVHPSWIGNGRLLSSFLGVSGYGLRDVVTETVRAGKTDRSEGREQWFDGPNEGYRTELQDGEISPDLKRMAFIGADWTNSGPPNKLVFYEVNGFPEDAVANENPYDNETEPRNPPTHTCTLTVENGQLSDITWSPDGGRLAWADADSQISVMSGVPAGGTCAVPEVKVIAQGSSPDWGPAGVPEGSGLDGPDEPGTDSTPPAMTGLSLAPKKFRAVEQGTKISFTLSELASVGFAFERVLPGRRAGGRCVKPTSRNRGARRCKRYKQIRGGLARRGEQGANSFTFSGRVGKRTLAPGVYRVSAVAVDAAGNQSNVVQRGFTVVRKPGVLSLRR